MRIEKIAVNCICKTRSSLQFPLCFWIFTIINLNCYFFLFVTLGKTLIIIQNSFQHERFIFSIYYLFIVGNTFWFFFLLHSTYLQKFQKTIWVFKISFFFNYFFDNWKYLTFDFGRMNILPLFSTQMYALKYWNQ